MEIYEYPSKKLDDKLEKLFKRGMLFDSSAHDDVLNIIYDIKKNKDAALLKYINKFDSPDMTLDDIKVSEKEFEEAFKQVSNDYIKSINVAYKNIKRFHEKQLENSWFETRDNGAILGQMLNPVESALIYVPGAQGGKNPLVSTVLMCAIPAKIAGVRKVFLTSPSRSDNSLDPHILVAAKTCKVDEVYKIGSAWAIACFAFGTKTIPKADIIVGPGNIYVTLAKKILSGVVGIDMIAGPSEILIIADKSANPKFLAADLLSQAEHDKMASSVLISDSIDILKETILEIEKQKKLLKRDEIIEVSLKNYALFVLTKDIPKAVDLANYIAPEHLELQVKNPYSYINDIKNAGALFLGQYSPEAVGDYIAGTNHVLPTNQNARFASALSTNTFLKKTSLVYYSKQAFKEDASHIMCLSEIEGLDAHKNSVALRMKEEGNL